MNRDYEYEMMPKKICNLQPFNIPPNPTGGYGGFNPFPEPKEFPPTESYNSIPSDTEGTCEETLVIYVEQLDSSNFPENQYLCEFWDRAGIEPNDDDRNRRTPQQLELIALFCALASFQNCRHKKIIFVVNQYRYNSMIDCVEGFIQIYSELQEVDIQIKAV
ncbi:MAG: hypothetical protein QF454_05330 [Candidatus Thalassarchaeaceae archaeon]|jgi:hypothetical protein|nr:hypothetical protein [Candidatus Thalassarchaeaceae archaeon]